MDSPEPFDSLEAMYAGNPFHVLRSGRVMGPCHYSSTGWAYWKGVDTSCTCKPVRQSTVDRVLKRAPEPGKGES